MELAEAAAVIGADVTTRTYFGQEISNDYNIQNEADWYDEVINETIREYSPITMNHQWSWIWRLFFLILFTGTGTLVNAFFVATFCITQELQKKGNIFLACLGFTDLIITAMVIPSVIVVMLTQIKETTETCKILQILTQWSTYAYSVFFMLVAVDTYTRLVGGYTRYRIYIANPICLLAVLNFIISLATASIGVYFGLDYDYCNRQHYGNFWFRLTTSIVFYVIPCMITICLLLNTSCVMKDRVVRLIRYKRYQQYAQDKDLTNLHLGCYSLFVTAWFPYLILVNVYPDATDAKYYALIWIGLIRSAITSFLYSAMNEHFRNAFYDLFIYFCCKSYNTQPHSSRKRRRIKAVNGVKAQILNNTSSPNMRRPEPPIQYVM